ncbi:hypothetical protein OSSY52_20680 [Tepiditoga spiralis]|uniref:Uncharacterized protein n=1 Tax=Tepiditoga spiralis TaxID=2108365 RepID=A0A7G1GA48_9BACT|nr:hypothetical protein [Tepiditoga spiralis]BBE31927.1 hypothetical protein OSSY52_20680 [Tepiditoga spiralis]
MKYITKSPKEWEEYDKNKNNNNNNYKKMRKMTSFIIIAISLMVILFTIFGDNFLPQRFDMKIIDGFNFTLLTKDTYYYPEFLDIKVKMQNIKKQTNSFTLKNFTFIIINKDDGNVLYNFVYNKEVKNKINTYVNQTIYDLTKEKKISNIKKGNYEIRVSFKLNEKDVVLTKEFYYSHDLKLNLYPYKDFFLSTENPKIGLEIFNQTNETEAKEIKGILKVIKKDKEIYKENINFGSISLNPMTNKVLNIELKTKLNEGTYTITFETPAFEKMLITILNITKKIDYTSSKLYLSNLSLPIIEKGQTLYYIAKLNNRNKENRGIEIKQMIIKVYYNDEIIYKYIKVNPVRVYLPSFGTKGIFDLEKTKKIKLDKAGTYNVEFIALINGKTFNKKQKIEVK